MIDRPNARVATLAAGALALVMSSCGGAAGDAAIGVAPTACPADGRPYVQVLGSGGPMHAQGRGGSAYALWMSDRPIFVVDMGADTPTALARAGADPGAVEVLLISHLHPDHVSGLPDFLWGEVTAARETELVIAGPDGDDDAFPDLTTFIDRLVGADGAFPRMRGLLAGSPFALRQMVLPVIDRTARTVVDHAGVEVSALAVPHGPAPALAFRLDGPGFRVVFAGDQTAEDAGFAAFAADADVLVVHAMVTDAAADHALGGIVATPERLGALARASRAKRVVLSHLMGQPGDSAPASLWSLSNVDAVVDGVRRAYHGRVDVATDLVCIGL